jgi:hypothetical protein
VLSVLSVDRLNGPSSNEHNTKIKRGKEKEPQVAEECNSHSEKKIISAL